MSKIKRLRICCFLIALILALTSSLSAEQPLNRVESGWLKHWLVLGPVTSSAPEDDVRLRVDDATDFNPEAGDFFITRNGDTLWWRAVETRQNVLDFSAEFGPQQHVAGYAFCQIVAPHSGDYTFNLGSDDGVTVWVNGREAFANPAQRPLIFNQDRFDSKLNPGSNVCLVKVTQGVGTWNLAVRVADAVSNSGPLPEFFVSGDYLPTGVSLSNNAWQFYPGDTPEWAQPDVTMPDAPFVNPELYPGTEVAQWNGTGWFRLPLVIDSALIGKPLALRMWQAGASRVYLDGQPVADFSRATDRDGVPAVIITFSGERQLLAIRYVNPDFQKYHDAGYNAGFSVSLADYNRVLAETIRSRTVFTGLQMFFTAFPLAIGLLHLVLFAFLPSMRQNLFFSLFLFTYAATVYFDYQTLLALDAEQHLTAFRAHCAVLPLWVIFQMWFIYSLFYPRLPAQFWVIGVAAVILGGFAVLQPQQNFEYFGLIYIVTYVEIIRVIVVAWQKRIPGTAIIGMGLIVFFVFGLLDTLMDKGIIESLRSIENPYAFGSIGFFLAMSIYLSRDFARSNKKMVRQELENKILEAENARQASELEAARQLQLSMLPARIPEHPDYEIAVSLQTATEVGGDYYDYAAHNGQLTLAVGDATGHGMKAGTMVAIMKSLFTGFDGREDVAGYLRACSRAIRDMHLGNLYMALVLLQLSRKTLRVSSAGMPPVAWYRARSGEVEEIVLKAMPLGGPRAATFHSTERALESGDALLVMSDGLAELFNPSGEQFDFSRIHALFREVAGLPAAVVIDRLKTAALDWAGSTSPGDDITLMVIKIK
jgi:serine phosphatase RsbU (regulator of sigma subunit)